MRVLVTGSSGFIGQRVVLLLKEQGHKPIPFDCPADVMDADALAEMDVDACIHLAADKHAGNGEEHPARLARLNIEGTANVANAFPRTILASTCKAAAPITCYGASKLIAERIVLNAGGSVVRLVNVLGSSGSVTEIWDAIPKDQPIPVTNTARMFMEPDQAARLLVRALELPPGRYGPRTKAPVQMRQIAAELYPERPIQIVPLRNGDRPVERLINDYEHTVAVDEGMVEIVDLWQGAELAIAA